MAKYHEKSVYFSTNAILALCHAPPELRNSKCAGYIHTCTNYYPVNYNVYNDDCISLMHCLKRDCVQKHFQTKDAFELESCKQT